MVLFFFLFFNFVRNGITIYEPKMVLYLLNGVRGVVILYLVKYLKRCNSVNEVTAGISLKIADLGGRNAG